MEFVSKKKRIEIRVPKGDDKYITEQFIMC